MADKKKFEVPVAHDLLETPDVAEGVMAHSQPYIAKPEIQQTVGFPGELVDNWQEVAVAKLGELTGKYRGLQVYLDSCVKCGACTDSRATGSVAQGLPPPLHVCG